MTIKAVIIGESSCRVVKTHTIYCHYQIGTKRPQKITKNGDCTTAVWEKQLFSWHSRDKSNVKQFR